MSVPPASGVATAGAAGTNKSWHSQPQPEGEEEEKERRGGEKISPTRPPITRGRRGEERGRESPFLLILPPFYYRTAQLFFSVDPCLRACLLVTAQLIPPLTTTTTTTISSRELSLFSSLRTTDPSLPPRNSSEEEGKDGGWRGELSGGGGKKGVGVSQASSQCCSGRPWGKYSRGERGQKSLSVSPPAALLGQKRGRKDKVLPEQDFGGRPWKRGEKKEGSCKNGRR